MAAGVGEDIYPHQKNFSSPQLNCENDFLNLCCVTQYIIFQTDQLISEQHNSTVTCLQRDKTKGVRPPMSNPVMKRVCDLTWNKILRSWLSEPCPGKEA